MTDVLFLTRSKGDYEPGPPTGLEPGAYYVGTIHRPDNTDDPGRLGAILTELSQLDKPVLLLAHPRLRACAEQHGIRLDAGALLPISPLAYPQLINAVQHSAGVVTDSGGLQKEAFLLRVPCTTVRPETEWVETVDLGWNVLVSEDLSQLRAAVTRPQPVPTAAAPYGSGQAAQRVVTALLQGARTGRRE
ncbi:hypothetical protein GCM10009672_16450 [Nesterenkonia lutea]